MIWFTLSVDVAFRLLKSTTMQLTRGIQVRVYLQEKIYHYSAFLLWSGKRLAHIILMRYRWMSYTKIHRLLAIATTIYSDSFYLHCIVLVRWPLDYPGKKKDVQGTSHHSKWDIQTPHRVVTGICYIWNIRRWTVNSKENTTTILPPMTTSYIVKRSLSCRGLV